MKTLLALLLACVTTHTAFAAQVSLTWTASTDTGGSGLAGYKIYRDGTMIGTSATNSYTDTTVIGATHYNYTISAYDNAGNESGQSAGAEFVFTPLHTYYIAPTGCSDANAGTSSGSPWCTPNHSVVCGDVIIAASGNYASGQFGNTSSSSFGNVSGCPSTTGGIDGIGGVYFAVLLCGGPDVESCRVDGGAGPAFELPKSNWAISGFRGTQNTNADRGCFNSLGTSVGTMWHHIAYINNIASTCDLAGFGTGNTGISNAGADQTAIVGGIVYNGANSLGAFSLCGSGISIIPASQNADAGTHIFVSQNFIYKSMNAPGGTQCTVGGGTFPHSDGNGLILDTFAGNPPAYTQKTVVKNNVLWLNGNACIQIFPQGNNTTDDKAQYYISNNTCWSNNQDPHGGCSGEIWAHGLYPKVAGGGIFQAAANIVVATMTTCGNQSTPGANEIFAILMAGEDSHQSAMTNPPISISSNYFYSTIGPHPGIDGDGGVGARNTFVINNLPTVGCTTAPCYDAPWVFGTNTKVDPGLTNPAGLPTTAPDCTGYTNVVTCMNTKYGVRTLIMPTIASTTLGYQPPSDVCVSDPDYPVWLKGVTYLRVSGSTVLLANGLVTRAC